MRVPLWPAPDQTSLRKILQSNRARSWIALLSESLARRYGTIRSKGVTTMQGNRNILFLIIGALIVGIGVLGYSLYQEKKEPQGLQINVGKDGLKIENK